MDPATGERKFVVPEFIFGVNARLRVARYAHDVGIGRALVVTDGGVRTAGWVAEATAALEAAGIHYCVFDELTPNPKTEEVVNGSRFFLHGRCDGIIAIGGGSVIDCAKGIGILVANPSRHILDFAGIDLVEHPIPPLICLPTMGGTAAELTQFAVITDRTNRRKTCIVAKAILPDVALIDPVPTITTNPYHTACSGFDALCHGIEAYVSVAHSHLTDVHALEAIRLIWEFLPQAVAFPDDLKARTKVMLGGTHAGIAFSNASLGAAHAMSHAAGWLAPFAHGEANAVFLPPVIRFNRKAVGDRYASIAATIGLSAEEDLADEIDRFRRRIGISSCMHDLPPELRNIPELAAKALREPCLVTNPVQPTQRELEELYESAF